jgi:hypothetical protein
MNDNKKLNIELKAHSLTQTHHSGNPWNDAILKSIKIYTLSVPQELCFDHDEDNSGW